jgi:hypothetical protein
MKCCTARCRCLTRELDFREAKGRPAETPRFTDKWLCQFLVADRRQESRGPQLLQPDLGHLRPAKGQTVP